MSEPVRTGAALDGRNVEGISATRTQTVPNRVCGSEENVTGAAISLSEQRFEEPRPALSAVSGAAATPPPLGARVPCPLGRSRKQPSNGSTGRLGWKHDPTLKDVTTTILHAAPSVVALRPSAADGAGAAEADVLSEVKDQPEEVSPRTARPRPSR